MLHRQLGACLLGLALLLSSIATARGQATPAATPASPEDCVGTAEYVEAGQRIVGTDLDTVLTALDDPDATDDDYRAASDEFAAARDALAAITPPPAAVAYHEATLSLLDLFVRIFDNLATEDLFPIAYIEELDAIKQELDSAGAAFAQACGLVIGEPEATPIAADDAPSGERGSATDPWPMARFVDLSDGWILAVDGRYLDATGQGMIVSPSNALPEAGWQYVLVRIIATNQTSETTPFDAERRLRAVGQSGQIYTLTDNGCGTIPQPLSTLLVPPSGTIQGNVCWAVRAEDADDSLVVYDDPTPEDEGRRTYISLASLV